MTTRDEIQTRLLRALQVTPSEAGLRWLDQRVSQVASAPPVASSNRRFGTLRLMLRPALVLGAFMLVAGTVAGGMGLLDQLFQSSAPGWRTGWDRAERLDLSQTDAGVTITLERAYADLNQVLVGFTVTGLEPAPLNDHGQAVPVEWQAELRDPMGRSSQQWATSLGGTALAGAGLSAVGNTWEGAVAPMAGTWQLTFSAVGYSSGGFVSGECTAGNSDPACANPPVNAMVDGTWQFQFELPAPAGTVVSPNVSSTSGMATVTLTELRITPTMVSSRVALQVNGTTVADWSPLNGPGAPHLGSIRRGSVAYDFNVSHHVTQDPRHQAPEGDVNEFMAEVGSEQATGTWTLVIPELAYSKDLNGPDITLTGPWTLTVTIP